MPPPDLSPKPVRTDANDRSILSLKLQRDQLLKRKKQLASRIVTELERAKKFLLEAREEDSCGKRAAALLCLKKKAGHEKLIAQAENCLSVILKLIDDVEFSKLQASTWRH